MAQVIHGPYDTGNSNVDYRILITTSNLNTSARTVDITAALQFKNTAGWTGTYSNTEGTDYPIANYTIALGDTSANTTNTWSLADISSWKTLNSVSKNYPVNDDNSVSYTYSAYSTGTVTLGSLNTSGSGSIASGITTTTYTISYNANGGSGAPSSQTKTEGTALTLSSTVPTRSNYVFVGWAINSSTATSADYQPGDSYTSEASVTLYAVWTSGIICTVTFNANNGEGTMETQKLNSTQIIPLSACTYLREGYQFAGWATSADGSVLYRDCQRISGITSTTLTLYAIWADASGIGNNVWVKIGGTWKR